jgi:GNAT superfamily N-acetyltransferase
MAFINNVSYGYDPAAGAAIYAHYLGAPRSRAFVGFVDDEPVTCAAAFPTHQGVYLGAVATVEARRGRGYGEAASRHALACAMAESPGAPAILFTGPKRIAFYERMGFSVGAELRMFRPARRPR